MVGHVKHIRVDFKCLIREFLLDYTQPFYDLTMSGRLHCIILNIKKLYHTMYLLKCLIASHKLIAM